MCIENPSYYAIIPADVRYDKRLKANEKLLYAEITSLSNKKGFCWASNKYFADLYGVTAQAVSKWIKELNDIGYIEVEYVYRNGTKEIEKRCITLTNKDKEQVSNEDEQVLINDDEVLTNDDRGINKCLGGYKQKFKDNNIKENNKYNNKDNIVLSTIRLYNSICIDFPRAMENDTLSNLILRNQDYDYKTLFEIAQRSDFLSGRNAKFKANLEWLLRNRQKVMSGFYDDKKKPEKPKKDLPSYGDVSKFEQYTLPPEL